MPGTFANPKEAGSVMPSGCPAVWLDAQGRATVDVGLYASLNEEGRQAVQEEMARLEREHAEHSQDTPSAPPAPALVPPTSAERLARSVQDVNDALFELAVRLADFRDNLRAYRSTQEVSDAQPR